MWSLLKILKIELTHDPEIAFLGILSKIVQNRIIKRNLYMIFSVTLFAITKTWKQPKCPSTCES